MLKSIVSTGLMLLLLSACATAPSVQVVQTCPKLPPLDPLPLDALERDYSDQMGNFLQGLLLTPTSSATASNPAK